MSLDVIAYERVEHVKTLYDADGYPIGPETGVEREDGFTAWLSDKFPGRGDDIVHRGYYLTHGDSMSFRMGYGGVFNWRNWLAMISGWPLSEYDLYGQTEKSYAASTWSAESGPFWEFIFFSDGDGLLGPDTSAKLARDFAEFDDAARSSKTLPEYYDLYCTWRKAFEMAAGDGVVRFT